MEMGQKSGKKKDGGAALIGIVPKKDPAKDKLQGKRKYMMLPLDPEHWEAQHAALHDHSHDHHHHGHGSPTAAITAGAAEEQADGSEEDNKVVVRANQDTVARPVS
mmetsp:Transcript_38136/g.65886  ORF Transcript_38136/g.65886 Transcript_38136/m.65886 type:complete len:106 (-) Transcript_38136:8-325(-)